MTVIVRLKPETDPLERVEPGGRPVLTMNSSDPLRSSVTLGSGHETKIADPNIGAEVLKVSFDEFCKAHVAAKVTMLQDAIRCSVFINGQQWCGRQSESVYLYDGDVVSLDGVNYEYKVSISSSTPKSTGELDPVRPRKRVSRDLFNALEVDDGDQLRSRSASPAMSSLGSHEAVDPPEDSKSIPIDVKAASRLADEIQCSVCLEIQVHPRTLNPCGHTFCSSCLEKLSQCPQCRMTIESHVPARQLDNLICTLASVPNLIDQNDVDHYRERQKNTPKLQHATRSTRPSKKQRRYRYIVRNDIPQPNFHTPRSAFGSPTGERAAAAAAATVASSSPPQPPFYGPPHRMGGYRHHHHHHHHHPHHHHHWSRGSYSPTNIDPPSPPNYLMYAHQAPPLPPTSGHSRHNHVSARHRSGYASTPHASGSTAADSSSTFGQHSRTSSGSRRHGNRPGTSLADAICID